MKNFWNLRLNKTATLLFAISPFFAFAQFSKPESGLIYDAEKYIYPVNPGQPGSLAGTMGELRPNHFHSGIDIRTNNMTGYPVLASKSGYISRITMGPSGYGNIIYITHPDGNTTLYAHLDKFKGAIAKHVLEEQYTRKTFAVDLYFKENEFRVKQGDTIALSGNTGSSGGPHLHFDIRDSQNYALDPLKVAGFPEITDNLPPAAEKVALRTLDINSRINDRFGRFEFNALRTGNKYSIASPILASGTIGVEIVAKDRLAPNSPFYGGVNYIELRVDGQLAFSQAIEKVDISETRAINTLMDFKTVRNKGTRFYKLYIDDGNLLKFYENSPGSGKIKINADKEALIEIIMKDSYGNQSQVSFRVRPTPVVKEVKHLEAMTTSIFSDITENTLTVTARWCGDSSRLAKLYAKGTVTEIEPDYFNNNRSVYLIDLRKTIPDSVVVCGKSVVTGISEVVPSGAEYKYYGDRMDIYFPQQALYDTLYLAANHSVSDKGTEMFSIGERTIPLHKNITISLKPVNTYAWDSSTAVYRVAGKSYSYIGGEYVNGRIQFSTREFGDFTIMQDKAAPTIKVVNLDRIGARFIIKDNLSGIASYDAYINGEWLLMHYDAKTATIWSEKLDKKQQLKGIFELIVTDNAGNKSTYTKKIL